jgi:hypothetical protein
METGAAETRAELARISPELALVDPELARRVRNRVLRKRPGRRPPLPVLRLQSVGEPAPEPARTQKAS